MRYNLSIQLLAAATCILAAPLSLSSRASTIAYKGIPVAEGVPTGTLGDLYIKFNPSIKVENACQPYPAVDADGNVSEGLLPIDNTLNDCEDASKAQVYARAYHEQGQLHGELAIMYAWYMPKEMHKPQPDKPMVPTQHKHAWHWIIVYLSSVQPDAAIKKVTYQGADGPLMLANPLMNGSSPNVLYKEADDNTFSITNTPELGEKPKLLAWERFTKAAKDAISTADFGGSKAPFGDYNTFTTTVIKAWDNGKIGD